MAEISERRLQSLGKVLYERLGNESVERRFVGSVRYKKS